MKGVGRHDFLSCCNLSDFILKNPELARDQGPCESNGIILGPQTGAPSVADSVPVAPVQQHLCRAGLVFVCYAVERRQFERLEHCLVGLQQRRADVCVLGVLVRG
jgi:hypothetical protein